MIEELFIRLGRVYPEIWAAIINGFVLLWIARVVKYRLKKIDRSHEEELTRLSPTFQLKISETREFIRFHYETINTILDHYFYIPKDYLVFLDKEHNFKKGSIDLILPILKHEDPSIAKKVEKLQKEHQDFYSVYISIIPDPNTYRLTKDLRSNEFNKFIQGSPLVNYQIKQLSDELLRKILNKLHSKELDKLIKYFDFEDIEASLKIQDLEFFWKNVERELYQYVDKMHAVFDAEWNKPV
jgi:Txe/YoeB family toxin of Txe-Axe toxin-antitoxin module